MSLKAKLVSVISAFVLILTVAIVSVWAVSQANVTMGGTVGFKADNVYAKISAKITGMEPNPTLPTLIFSEGDDASPVELIEEWADLSLIFANSNTPIQLEITVENLSGERALYAKIDDQIGVVANLTKTVTSSSQDALGRYIEVPISSSITYTITLSPTNPNKSVNGEYRYLITLVDETEATGIQIQAEANQASLGSVSGGGTFDLGDTVTLRATRSGSNTFLAWATSLDPNTMEILSTSTSYSFELTEDSPRAYYALFNSTTSTSQTVGNLIYTFYNEAGLAEITDTTSNSVPSGDYTIPSVVLSGEDSYKLYSIGNNAFQSCSSLTSITIPEGVTSIGNNAFNSCRSLTSIIIPEGVTSIYDSAFSSCSGLTSITLPRTLTSIGAYAFQACSSLTSITIPEGVTSIGNSAFSSCNNLASINLPGTLTSIGAIVFNACRSLEAFHGPGNSYYIIDDNRALIINGTTFYAYAAGNTGTSYSVPEGVTSIGAYAFQACSSLTSITIPEGVTSIGSNAFSYCRGLTSITLPRTLTSIGTYAFQSCSSLTSITIPEGVTSIGSNAFYRCSALTSITIPEGVTSIGNSAFYECSNLAEITINGNTSIASAFYGCYSLTKLTLGANVTSLPSDLFLSSNMHMLTNLTTIVVEEGSTLSAALPTYGKWVKDGGSEIQTNFSGAGTYTRTDIQ